MHAGGNRPRIARERISKRKQDLGPCYGGLLKYALQNMLEKIDETKYNSQVDWK
jgi:hypothetical protein